MKGVTTYDGISGLYFHRLLMELIEVGNLNNKNLTILDFGCGLGNLKKLLPETKVIGYDIIPELSDIDDWRSVKFDVLVANQVFYSFSVNDLENFLIELKKLNPKVKLIVGISNQGILNNIGKYLLGKPHAHSATRITPIEELQILSRYCSVKLKKSFFNLTTIYVLNFNQ